MNLKREKMNGFPPHVYAINPLRIAQMGHPSKTQVNTKRRSLISFKNYYKTHVGTYSRIGIRAYSLRYSSFSSW